MTDKPCATRCSARPDSESFPLSQVRHGIDLSTGGLFGPEAISLVDLDVGTLSFVEFDVDLVNGKRRTTVIDRGDIALGADDLAQIGATANSIWTSPMRVPTARVGLDGFWSITVFNGANQRSETGMGDIGGAGRLLSTTLYKIQMTQMPYFFVQNRRRYLMWSCYQDASKGHASAPMPHLRTPGYSGDDVEDIPQSFPIPQSDPLRFRFDVGDRQSTCADIRRVLAVQTR
ncbi:hypothetical protein BFF94_001055 [Burkholderia catarinensis]|nr:hypothetical protein BFF94_001055 [Burkholderia catarinensis]